MPSRQYYGDLRNTMEICAILMEECKEKKEFKQPEAVVLIEPKEHKPLIFDEKDNKVNLRRCQKKKFYDASVCRHLCSTTLVLKTKKTSPINNCEEMCFELTRSSELAGEICPFQKYCPNGCPCENYVCDKISAKDQEVIPVWDLESKTNRSHTDSSIFQRREALGRKPHTFGFNVTLHDYNSENLSEEVFVKQDVLFPHEWIVNIILN